MTTTNNPFAYPKPITLGTLGELFAHHRSITGGHRMTAGTGEPDAAAAAAAQAAAAEKATADAAAAAAKKTADDAAAAAKATPTPPPVPEPTHPDYFPPDTPVAEMSVAHQVNYWKHQSKKHEGRATEWRDKVGGGSKTAAQVADELEKSRLAGMSAQDRAIEEAKAEGRREGASQTSDAVATLVLETAFAHVEDEDRRKVIIQSIDRSTVKNDDGTISTDKVKAVVAALAPVKGGTRTPDLGGGSRRPPATGSGVSAGAARFREQHPQKTTTTS